ncbi:NADPH-dependent FMN reductase [Streptomyces sp. RKCA744]|uniref:NADPH-dependent FMN reductase n=1 Tax=Streptomyces sp. RKCA744 TaxID=2959340 RepID=UPI0035ABD499
MPGHRAVRQGHGRPEAYADPLARRLSPMAARADALVLATPTYHGSFSGVLKNALDHLAGHELRGKPVGLLAHGENLTAVQVCDALRTVVRALKGMAVPEQLVTVPGDFDRVGNGQRLLTAPPALDRLDALCRSLVTVTRQLATGEAIGIGTA